MANKLADCNYSGSNRCEPGGDYNKECQMLNSAEKQYLRDFMAIDGKIDDCRKVLRVDLPNIAVEGIYSAISKLHEERENHPLTAFLAKNVIKK